MWRKVRDYEIWVCDEKENLNRDQTLIFSIQLVIDTCHSGCCGARYFGSCQVDVCKPLF